MTRKTFITSLIALLTAPFIGKSKEKEREELESWIKANPVLFEQIVRNAVEREAKLAIEAGHTMINLGGRLIIKGSDLKMDYRK